MPTLRTLIVWLAAGLIFAGLPSPTRAGDLPKTPSTPTVREPLPDPGSDAWSPLTFPKVERHTRYERTQAHEQRSDEHEPGPAPSVLQARADCSASGLMLSFPNGVDLQRTPRLRWRWRVARGLSVDDERSKGGDDFAARVYVMFEFDSAQATTWERMRRRLGTALYGEGLPGKAIAYVWTSRAETGEIWTNPYSPDTEMVALRRSTDTAWHTETVDLLADRSRLLGPGNDPIMAIALMSDSDDTCQQAEAYYADFELLAAETNLSSVP